MQRRNLVVKRIAAFIKPPSGLAQGCLHKLSRQMAVLTGTRRRIGLRQQIQQAAGIAIGVRHPQRQCDGVIAQVGQGGVQGTDGQGGQLFGSEAVQYIHLCSRQQGRVDLKRGVLGGRANKRHHARFHIGQQRVLLGFIKPVNLVHKQQGALAAQAILRGLGDGFPNLLDPRKYRRQGHTLTAKRLRHQPCQRGFADPRWPPQNHGMRRAGLKSQAQRLTRAQQMRLPNDLIQSGGAQGFGQRRGQGGRSGK